MKSFKALATAFCLFSFCLLVVPTVSADELNQGNCRHLQRTRRSSRHLPSNLAGRYLRIRDHVEPGQPSHCSHLQPGQKQGPHDGSWRCRTYVCTLRTRR